MACKARSPKLARQIGLSIRRARLAAGVTQGELALECNVSPERLALIEAGKRLPSTALLVDIAGAVGVSPGALLPG